MNNPKSRKRLICLLLGLSFSFLSATSVSAATVSEIQEELDALAENVQILSGLTPGETCYYAYFDTYVKTNNKQATVSFNLLGTEKNRSR